MRGFVVAAAVAGALAVPASADASTICVPDFFSACADNTVNLSAPTPEAAMAMNANDGVPDTVYIDQGTFTDPDSLKASGTDDLEIIGSGSGTVLTTSSMGDTYVVDLNTGNNREITLSSVEVLAPASLQDGGGAAMQVHNDTLEDVGFVSQNPGTDGLASIIGGVDVFGASFTESGAGSFDRAVSAGSSTTGTARLRRVDIDGPVIGISMAGPGTVDVARARIRLDGSTGQDAVVQLDGTVDIENSIIETPDGVPLFAAVTGAASPTLNADGLTMVDTTPASPSYPAGVSVNNDPGATGTATLNLSNSIAYDFSSGYAAVDNGGPGSANLAIRYSNQKNTGVVMGGAGATTTNVTEFDPLFTDRPSGDYSLTDGSPSIDAGDPASTLASDFRETARPLDGDSVPGARVDQGAFEFDDFPPETTIDSGPGADTTVGSEDVQFEFSGTVGDTAKLQCELDGGGYIDCISPKTFFGLSEGEHIVKFRAEDPSGNQDPSPVERKFSVDTVAPNTTIDSGPTAGATITTSSAAFGFHGSAPDTAKVQCKLDGGAFADCTSPKTFSGLSDGSHTVAFRAQDAVGNQDATPATRTFIVDTPSPPDTKAPETTIDSGPGKKAKKGKVKFAFSANEKSSFECSLVKKGKPAAFETCTSPQSYTLKRKKKTTKYVFSVRATDSAGNTDKTPASAGVKVKKKPKKK